MLWCCNYVCCDGMQPELSTHTINSQSSANVNGARDRGITEETAVTAIKVHSKIVVNLPRYDSHDDQSADEVHVSDPL